jgi:hypothetical protein
MQSRACTFMVKYEKAYLALVSDIQISKPLLYGGEYITKNKRFWIRTSLLPIWQPPEGAGTLNMDAHYKQTRMSKYAIHLDSYLECWICVSQLTQSRLNGLQPLLLFMIMMMINRTLRPNGQQSCCVFGRLRLQFSARRRDIRKWAV